MVKQFVVFGLLSAPFVFGQRDPEVPSALLVAAQQSPLELVMALADASVPAGLELLSSDRLPRRKPAFDVEPRPTVGLTDLRQAFNTRHADYRAAVLDDVLVVRPTRRTAAYLDQDSNLEPIVITGVMAAARKIFADLDPALARPGGLAGSAINLDPQERGEYTDVSLDGRGRKVIDVLNQLAKQSQRAWVVITSNDDRPPRVLEFGLIHRGGSSTRVSLSGSDERR